MRKAKLIIIILFISISVSGKNERKGLIDVLLIKNNGDTILVQSKANYYNEHSFNSFGYYNEDGSRGRAHADEYQKIIIRNKCFESVYLKSTVKKDCKKQVFLERIIDGPMVMYTFHYVKQMVYTSKCIDEIYIRRRDEKCAYPIYKKLCPHEIISLTLIKQPNNKKDMLRLFEDTPSIVEKMKSGYYDRSSYETIIREYNSLMKLKN